MAKIAEGVFFCKDCSGLEREVEFATDKCKVCGHPKANHEQTMVEDE